MDIYGEILGGQETAAICAIRAVVGPNGPTNDADGVEVATVHA